MSTILDFWFHPSGESNLLRHWIPISDRHRQSILNTIESFIDTIYPIFHHALRMPYDTSVIRDLSLIQRMEAIVILDQWSRNLGHKYPNVQSFIPHLTRKALVYSFSILEDSSWLSISPNYLLFVLMPFKHLDVEGFYPFVSRVIKRYLRHNNTDLQDHDLTYLQNFYIDFTNKALRNVVPQLVDTNVDYDYASLKSVCESIPEDFLESLYIFTESSFDALEDLVYKFLMENRIQGTVVVSLSGGVDSNVLLYILKRLSQEYPIRPVAFHLNYKNRLVAPMEQQLVQAYCNKLEVPLYVYEIEYLKRGEIQREAYEAITRKIRFQCYRCFPDASVVLGHIQDDCIENIFTNLATNKHMWNLKRMYSVSMQDGVRLLRPFITTVKQDIYDYAEQHGIPHLLNTTPTWSNRGKFRNHFLPAFADQYSESGIINMVSFAEQLENYGRMIQETIVEPKIRMLMNHDKISFYESELNNAHLIREIFTGYCHRHGIGMPTEKSIRDFIERYRKELTSPSNHVVNFPIKSNVMLKIHNRMIWI